MLAGLSFATIAGCSTARLQPSRAAIRPRLLRAAGRSAAFPASTFSPSKQAFPYIHRDMTHKRDNERHANGKRPTISKFYL